MAIESKLKPSFPRSPLGGISSEDRQKKTSRVMNHVLLIFLLVLLVGAGIFFAKKWMSSTDANNSSFSGITTSSDANTFQAVFLDNGQVYFGKLQRTQGNFYHLSTVYYIQQGLGSLTQDSSLSLIRLGSEAHGPQDFMDINKDHILFIETMKPDSKVMKAILGSQKSS